MSRVAARGKSKFALPALPARVKPRVLLLCLVAAFCLGVGFPAAGAVTPEATPVLRLVYMANSAGAALPCPS